MTLPCDRVATDPAHFACDCHAHSPLSIHDVFASAYLYDRLLERHRYTVFLLPLEMSSSPSFSSHHNVHHAPPQSFLRPA
jgi:hypothetical protein